VPVLSERQFCQSDSFVRQFCQSASIARAPVLPEPQFARAPVLSEPLQFLLLLLLLLFKNI
jgi:hypothetical protein